MFNGGIGDGAVPFFIVLFFMGNAVLENKYEERVNRQRQLGRSIGPGDFGFDPLGISKEEGAFRQRELRDQELFNGRLAMLAITGFSVQEFFWGTPVIQQTPIFFGR